MQRLIVGADTLLTTPEHLFYSGGGWVAASALRVGMPVQASVGVATVLANQVFDSVATVYNFAVAYAHTYHVGRQGLLVHNDCKGIADALKLIADNSVRQALIADLQASARLARAIAVQPDLAKAWEALHLAGRVELKLNDVALRSLNKLLLNTEGLQKLGVKAEDFAKMLKPGGWPTPPAVVSFADLCEDIDKLVKALPSGRVVDFVKFIGSSGFNNANSFTRYHAYVQLQRLLENKSILQKAENINFERKLSGSLGNSVSDVRVKIGPRIIEIETKAGDEFFTALTGETNFVTQCSNSLEAVNNLEDYKVFLRPSKVAELSGNAAALSAAKTRVINAWKAKGLLENPKIFKLFNDFNTRVTKLPDLDDVSDFENYLQISNDWFTKLFIDNILL